MRVSTYRWHANCPTCTCAVPESVEIAIEPAEIEVCPMCIGDKVVLDEPCDECDGKGRVAAEPAAEKGIAK